MPDQAGIFDEEPEEQQVRQDLEARRPPKVPLPMPIMGRAGEGVGSDPTPVLTDILRVLTQIEGLLATHSNALDNIAQAIGSLPESLKDLMGYAE